MLHSGAAWTQLLPELKECWEKRKCKRHINYVSNYFNVHCGIRYSTSSIMSLELIASNGWQLQKVYFQFISRVNCPWIEASKYIGVVSSPYQNIWII